MIQISSSNYMPEFGMEDTSLFQEMDSFAFNFDDISYLNTFSSASTPESTNSSHYNNNKRFHSQTTQINSFPIESPDQSVASATPPTKASSSSKIISFDNMNSRIKKPKTESGYGENLNFGSEYDKRENKVAAAITNRNPIQARDHVIAERKRRQKLNQKFITLSSILPGLKKMDKATILEDAIIHLNQLKEQVKNLEEQVADKKVESAVFMKRSILFADDDSSSSYDENSDQSLPKIEARVSGKDMLIRIHSNKLRGRTATAILNKLEKHHLSIQSSSVLPFGNNYLDITIVAEVNKEYCLTLKDLIRSINQVLNQLV
ncbi:transcription factor bHLH19 [Lathyrus oleraceus]|uniref:BHLH domain-containing protein n=1 Tax=Pisum sativum TaxID=3888 RepID=A0A9D4XB25_PEA|nr:transcription factor bHLH19-like [Pisum sativum]KAI5417839.1 hypothetical protein KIW84_042453 [Pisum sativum]